MKIPKQLQNDNFRFIKIKGFGKKPKSPLEKEWQTKNNYKWNDPIFQEYLKNGTAYGVVCGYGGLVVLDFDDESTQISFMKHLPETFTVKTGGKGLYHTYFICEKMFSTRIDGKLDVQADNTQVIGSSSKFKDGNEYVVEKDIDIAKINYDTLTELIDSYNDFLNKQKPEKKKIGTDKKYFFKKGSMKKHKFTKLLLSETLPEGGRNSILWFQYKCLVRDSGIDFSSKEFQEINNEVNKIQKDRFEPNIPDKSYNFNPFTVNDWCDNNGYDLIFKINKKNENKDEYIYLSFLYDEVEQNLIEQVYDGNNNQFCVYNIKTEEISYCDEYTYKGNDYKPIQGEEIVKKAILLPSKAVEYNNEEDLDKEINDHIYKWLDVDDEHRQFAVWNIKRSWMYDKFNTLNYMRALGDTGQGKSRYLKTIGSVHYKTINTTGATTPAPIFRMIDKWKGTLCIDEADFQKSDESQDIIKIINQGFEKDDFIMRCDENNRDKVKFFDVFCPKILATRKVFNDKAVESRCITKIMTGTFRKDIKFELNDNFWNKALEIRNKLLMWRFRNYNKIDNTIETDVDISKYEPRLQQIIGGFVLLFAKNRKELDKFLKIIDIQQENIIDERKNSFAGEIVSAIHRLVVNKKLEDISVQDIIEEGDLKYKGIQTKPRALTSHLKALGFKSSYSKRINDKIKRCIPLEELHLKNLFERYGFSYEEDSEEISEEEPEWLKDDYM